MILWRIIVIRITWTDWIWSVRALICFAEKSLISFSISVFVPAFFDSSAAWSLMNFIVCSNFSFNFCPFDTSGALLAYASTADCHCLADSLNKSDIPALPCSCINKNGHDDFMTRSNSIILWMFRVRQTMKRLRFRSLWYFCTVPIWTKCPIPIWDRCGNRSNHSWPPRWFHSDPRRFRTTPTWGFSAPPQRAPSIRFRRVWR